MLTVMREKLKKDNIVSLWESLNRTNVGDRLRIEKTMCAIRDKNMSALSFNFLMWTQMEIDGYADA